MTAYRAGSSGAAITTNTGAAITSGVTTAADEVILATAVSRSPSTTVTTANGWQTIGSISFTNGTAFLFGRTAAGAESSWSSPILSSASQRQTRVIGVLQGVGLLGSYTSAELATGSGSTSPATIPSLTNGVAGGCAVCMFAMSRGTTLTFTTYTEDTDGNTGTGTTASTLGSGHLELAITAATVTGTVIQATAGNYGYVVAAINPYVAPISVSGVGVPL
jgi:hypothetical protein